VSVDIKRADDWEKQNAAIELVKEFSHTNPELFETNNEYQHGIILELIKLCSCL
jgi:hypothetical protein